MSARFRAWCECSWHGEYRTQGMADYAMSRHSCELWERRRAKKKAAVERKANLDRTERPCTHKIANHEHGTYERFTLDHCHCDPCRSAKTKYEKERRRARAYGEVAYVDARPATEHVRALMAAGMGWKRVALAAGVDNSIIYPMLYGRRDRNGGAPRTKARAATVAAILAVPFPTLDDLAAGRTVPAAGTRRRVHALQSIGWSVNQISARAGVNRQVFDGIERGGEQITAGNARAVRDTYEELWDQEPPMDGKFQRVAASRSRNHAAALGWPMPLDLEAIDVDDPNEPDPVREKGGRLTLDFDEWLHLVRSGEQPERAARRCGVTTLGAVEVAATRLGRLAEYTTAKKAVAA